MTKPLYPLSPTRMTMADLAQFGTRTSEDIEKSGIKLNSDEALPFLLNQHKQTTATFKKSLEQVRASDKTVALAKADRARDLDYKALAAGLRAFRYAKRENEQEAYASLHLLVKQYKPSTGRNYEAQTALFVNLTDKLTNPPYREQVNTLGLKRFVDNLIASNEAFDTLYASRAKEKLTKVAYDTKELKAQLLFNYNLLVDYINVMAQVKKTKPYTDLLPIVNHTRKTYAELLARGNKGRKAVKGEK